MTQPQASERVKLRVTGRVQGVYYRASTRERARALGLSGWVRNAPDGAVEIEAEGSAEAIQTLIDWCWQGPPAARVSNVAIEHVPAEGARSGFEVRH